MFASPMRALPDIELTPDGVLKPSNRNKGEYFRRSNQRDSMYLYSFVNHALVTSSG